MLGAAAAVYWAFEVMTATVPTGTPRQVTSGPGVETDPAISPDGTRIAFTSDESGTPDIWIAEIKGGPPRRLTTSPANDTEPAWFPDGGLAFVSNRSGQPGIWRAKALDETAAALFIDDAESPAVSPDGTEIAFVRLGPGGFTRVAVAPVADPSRVRVITTDRDGTGDHRTPSWSPDGRRVAYAAGGGLRVVPAAGGEAVPLTSVEHDGHPVWSRSGRFVYFTAVSDDDVSRLWRVRSTGGSRQPVTVGSGAEVSPDVSHDGRTLAFSTDNTERDIAIIDRATGRETTRFGSTRDDVEPAFAPDGRAVYFVSERFGAPDIWVQPLSDTGPPVAPRRVFDRAGDKLFPACSPDGRWLAYSGPEGNRHDIWLGPTAGGDPVRVTHDGHSSDPAWSPDGSALAFVSDRDGTAQLWIQRVRNGTPDGVALKITSGAGPNLSFPTWSPDGLRIACVVGGLMGAAEVGIASIKGGRPVTITRGSGAMRARWDLRSGAILVAGLWGASAYQVRSIRPDGSVSPDAPFLLGRDVFETLFDVSGDGRFIVTTRSKGSGHVWVLETGGRTY
jgi:Tol biopolymer transport system component